MSNVKGFTKIDNKVLFSLELHPYSKLVLTSLTYYTRNGEGSCFARKTTLSRMIGISLYHLRNSLRELEAKDLIHIVRPGQGKPDTIYLNDFKPASETTSHQHTTIEEDFKKEEEEVSNPSEDAKETPQNDPISSQPAPPTSRPDHKPLPAPETIKDYSWAAFTQQDGDTDYSKLLEDITGKRVKPFSKEALEDADEEDSQAIRSGKCYKRDVQEADFKETETINTTGIKTLPEDRQFGPDKGNPRRNSIEEDRSK